MLPHVTQLFYKSQFDSEYRRKLLISNAMDMNRRVILLLYDLPKVFIHFNNSKIRQIVTFAQNRPVSCAHSCASERAYAHDMNVHTACVIHNESVCVYLNVRISFDDINITTHRRQVPAGG